MVSSVSTFLFINIIIVLFINIIIVFLFPTLPPRVKLPFHPKDILPVLPRQVSRPILYALYNPEDLLPTFVGNANSTNRLDWKGACFQKNTAWLELHNNTGSPFGGGTLHIEVSKARTWTCTDIYIFVTPYRVNWTWYFLRGKHKFDFKEWEGEAEFDYVKKEGVWIFLMHGEFWRILMGSQPLWEVIPLFTNTERGEKSNIEFLKKHMGASFVQRPQPWVTNISVDDIHSGDILAMSKIRGRRGGFQTLQKWVTGTYAGHVAVFLKDPEGKLWVTESGRENEKGEEIIAKLPWEEWWDFELNKDDSNPHIALLPLHPETRTKFNEAAAWEYVLSMVGKPYGFHNLIFSWIDTTDDNYPPPVDAHLVAAVMTIVTRMKPIYGNMWNEALNKRLGTQGLSLPEILAELRKRGSSLAELLAIPEQDDWEYSDGESRSCVAFITQMYKVAGLFNPLNASSIQATEFTVKDVYMLNFFETNSSHLPQWCNNDGSNVNPPPICQILGKYRMELPKYNSMKPYPHMNEKCPSLPPKYSRPNDC